MGRPRKYSSPADRKRAWAEGNKERVKEVNRDFYHRHKDDRKEYRENLRLKSTYGISSKDYNRMFEEQKGCCYTCHTHQSQLKVALAVDHNHKTGEVRKLLCHKCNLALGYAQEDVNILQSLIDYLKR